MIGEAQPQVGGNALITAARLIIFHQEFAVEHRVVRTPELPFSTWRLLLHLS
jgi:hypothetical protein